MAETVVEGASLPDGIEVDETSAYFGITKSSDIIHELMSMDKVESMGQFFGLLSDIVLKPGEFDFEEASKAMNCEGGEIYYLVSGHFGLMNFTDPLLHYLGLPNSLGEDSPNPKPSLADTEYESLRHLSEPMNMLKIFAVANNNGGPKEVIKYYLTLDNLFQNVSSNISTLANVAEQFEASLDVIGHSLPITSLANSTVNISNLPTSKQVEVPKPEIKSPKGEEKSSPIKMTEPIIEKSIDSVPLPGKKKDLVEEVTTVLEPSIEVEITDRKAAKATQDAFEGAFGIANEEPANSKDDITLINETTSTIQEEEISKDSLDTTQEEPEIQLEQEEPFVSAAELFVQADVDDDGTLSVEELSEATGMSIEETEELHQSADVDDDGKMSLSEFISSPAAEKAASNLPRPVAPVRKPVNREEPKQMSNELQQNVSQFPQQPVQNIMPKPISPQNTAPQPISRPQPINQIPQQQWNQQPVQPTIRSGVMCRGCGIGIDPYWRFCPVCGGQNLG